MKQTICKCDFCGKEILLEEKNNDISISKNNKIASFIFSFIQLKKLCENDIPYVSAVPSKNGTVLDVCEKCYELLRMKLEDTFIETVNRIRGGK